MLSRHISNEVIREAAQEADLPSAPSIYNKTRLSFSLAVHVYI